MSSVEERRRRPGAFTVDLVADTPPEIRRQLTLAVDDPTSKGFALVVITAQWVDPLDYPPPADPETTPHPLLADARYTGILTDTSRRRTSLTGEGLLALINDSDGHGNWTGPLTDHVVIADADDIITAIIDGGTLVDVDADDVDLGASELRTGTIFANGTNVRISDLRSVRAVLDEVTFRTGSTYRVRPTGELDWGTAAQVHGTTPRTIIGNGLPAIHDPRWVTVRVDGSDWGESLRGYANAAIADSPTDAGVASSGAYHSPASPPEQMWSAVRLRPLLRHRPIDVDADESVADWRDRTEAAITGDDGSAQARWSVPLTGPISDDTPLIPGEQVLLWDPEVGIEGTPSDEILYAGDAIRPVTAPLIAVTWPITRGMGVYLLYVDTTATPVQRVLDLTDHVAFATDPNATLEVGVGSPAL